MRACSNRGLTSADDKGRVSIAQRGLHDQGIAVGPIVTVPRKQAHALALALDNQSVPVVLDFQSSRSGPAGTSVPRVGMQGSNTELRMRLR